MDQLLITPESLFFGNRILNPNAEELIIEEATKTSSNDEIHLKIQAENFLFHLILFYSWKICFLLSKPPIQLL